MSAATQRLIDEYGDGAYDRAVEFVVIAVRLGDSEGAEDFAEAGRELLQLGYHREVKPSSA